MASCATTANAQWTGNWDPPFNHEVSTASAPLPGIATDPGQPFGGLDAMTIYNDPFFGPFGWPSAGNLLADPALANNQAMFNAVHMCLIPKGPNQGKVLVWNVRPVVAKAPGFVSLAGHEWWAFQAWSIVDPAPNPTGVQFDNYLLPIEKVSAPTSSPLDFSTQLKQITSTANLFCAGHTWSPYGDLIVLGGTRFHNNGTLHGPFLTYLFNPAEPSAPWPTQAASLYQPVVGGTTAMGHWIEGPPLTHPRWYPTTTLSAPLPRIIGQYPNDGEVVLCLGGTRDFGNPSASLNYPWNTYEAFVIKGTSSFGVHNLTKDFTIDPTNNQPRYWWDGPGTQGANPPVDVDWLHEYPRCHLLTNGKLFFSGYAPRGAQLDHEDAGMPTAWSHTAPQSDGTPTVFSSNWNDVRHDGSHTLLPLGVGMDNAVMRIGGATGFPSIIGGVHNGEAATSTTEMSLAGLPWTPSRSLPATDGAPNGGRLFTNLEILPTGALLLIGGENSTVASPPGNSSIQSTPTPLIYASGKWYADAPNSYPTARRYHSTSVLLPDGRVMIGGGDKRQFDYEIYSPYYTLKPDNHQPKTVGFAGVAPAYNTITQAFELDHGAAYTLTCSIADAEVSVAKAVLTAPASRTHHSDMNARHIELDAVVESRTQIAVTIPTSKSVAPRGYYMLWLITDNDAVSHATWVRLK